VDQSLESPEPGGRREKKILKIIFIRPKKASLQRQCSSCKASRHVKYNPYNTLDSKKVPKSTVKIYTSISGNVGGGRGGQGRGNTKGEGEKKQNSKKEIKPKNDRIKRNRKKKSHGKKFTLYSDGFCTKWSSVKWGFWGVWVGGGGLGWGWGSRVQSSVLSMSILPCFSKSLRSAS